MIFQYFWYQGGKAFEWLVSMDVPNEMWILYQQFLGGFVALLNFMPKIPYIPYGDVAYAAILYLTTLFFGFLVVIAVNIVNMVIRMRS